LQTQHGEDRTKAQIEELNEESTWENIEEESVEEADQVQEERNNLDLTEVLIVELNEESTSKNIIQEDIEEERGNKDIEKGPKEEERSQDIEYQEREEEEKVMEDDESGISFTEAPVPPLVVNEAMVSLPPALAALEYPDYSLDYLPDVHYHYVDSQDMTDRPR
jgi:cation transport ATPase